MSTITQSNRLLKLVTPLGDDVLILTHFDGCEALSQSFNFNLSVLSKKKHIEPDQLVGKSATVVINLHASNTKQYLNGIIKKISAEDVDQKGIRHYTLELVSQLYHLECAKDCCIYQNKSIPEIIEAALQQHGVQSIEKHLKGNYPKREYCVQYRETAKHFIERLMAEVGIYYYFQHSNGKHTLIIADSADGYTNAKTKMLSYRPDGNQSTATITDWTHHYEFYTGRYAHRDYDFKKPTEIIQKKHNSQQKLNAASAFETYDYPGGYYYENDKGEKKAVAQLAERRQEAQEQHYNQVKGASTCVDLRCGSQFQLKGHDSGKEDAKYVVTDITHHAKDLSHLSGQTESSAYSNEFACMPANIVFRPSYTKPKPVEIHTQSATVVGAKGKEIDVDEYGRVKVQFHWDRKGNNDNKSSCRIRVLHGWAGQGFGMVHHPRVGQEVLVDFINGDPDNPVIIGSLYNGLNRQPYTLPDNATQSGIKTHSTPNGGKNEYNELRFEDKKGHEEIQMHAQKDLVLVAKQKLVLQVGGSSVTITPDKIIVNSDEFKV